MSVYLLDPDANGVELYYDRPQERWFAEQGRPILKAEPFDPRDLLAEASPNSWSFYSPKCVEGVFLDLG